jgi:hypothetical protein
LGADYLLDVVDLTQHFVELLVGEADLVFLFDEQPKHHVSLRIFPTVLKFAAQPPDILLSDKLILIHEMPPSYTGAGVAGECGAAPSPNDRLFFPEKVLI